MSCVARRSFLIVGLLAAAQLVAAVEPPAVHVKNFGQVDSHVYRGAEPSPVGLEELAAMGVKTVVDLRESSEATGFEKDAAQKLGIKYWNIPFKPMSAPTGEQVQRVLSLLTGGTDPVFVHCRRGKDRTGTVVACYRIQHDGWNNRKALDEANRYGMSSLERGMRSFIIRFHPQILSSLPDGKPLP